MTDLVLAARESLARAEAFLLSLQQDDGCWEGEVVWSPIILAQASIVREIVGRRWEEPVRREAVRHFEQTRTPEGGWGLHPESPATVFVTTLGYVAMRLLGLASDDPRIVPARRWLRTQPGGVLAIPTWGKFWLALLGLYGWEGVSALPPEAFLLPRWFPLHPRFFYCHTRHIYLAMAYLYGVRFRADLGPIREELARELYGDAWPAIAFGKYRRQIAASDLYARPGIALSILSSLLVHLERFRSSRRRARAAASCLERILYEQRESAYEALSPVNGLLNCLAIWSADPAHPDLEPSLAGAECWRWHDPPRGLRYAGARSNAWDTAFTLRALLETPEPTRSLRDARARAFGFLRDTQLTQELPQRRRHWRDSVVGGWCFSDGAHRWPVADCTAEALSAILKVQGTVPPAPGLVLGQERIHAAVRFLLDRQNPDGGFATYERRRGSLWLESLNPSEMFADCMTERSYVECTGSCLTALARFRASDPSAMPGEIEGAIARAIGFLRRAQLPDGSFPAAWGIQFTYAIFFAVEGLRTAGVARSDPALAAAASWLVGKQKADGGWGERYTGCLVGQYREHPQSQVTMTSWALLALLETLGADHEAVARGVGWLWQKQRSDGSWPAGSVNGVFFRTAMLDYRLYEAYFPAWAIARYVAYRSGRSPF